MGRRGQFSRSSRVINYTRLTDTRLDVDAHLHVVVLIIAEREEPARVSEEVQAHVCFRCWVSTHTAIRILNFVFQKERGELNRAFKYVFLSAMIYPVISVQLTGIG